MVMVKYPANPPAGALGDFACSLGGANADVLAGNGRALSDIACGVYGVKGDKLTRTLPDALGCGACTLGCSFADVSCTAANVATGTALLGLGLGLRLSGRLGCVRGLGLAVLAGSVLATDGECQAEERDGWNGKCGSHG
jgi:hypothetical protein